MISLNYRDSRPIYEQIRDGLRKLIVTGALSADEKLPSVRALAAQLAINPNTIQRAYTELERQGYIYSIQGKGSFVSDGRYLAEGIRKDWEKQFDAAIEEGLRIGVSYQDMIKILEEREGGKADA